MQGHSLSRFSYASRTAQSRNGTPPHAGTEDPLTIGHLYLPLLIILLAEVSGWLVSAPRPRSLPLLSCACFATHLPIPSLIPSFTESLIYASPGFIASTGGLSTVGAFGS